MENPKAVCPAVVTDFIRTDPRLRIVGQNRGLTRLKELGAMLGRTTLTSFSLSSLPGPVGKTRLYLDIQSMTQQLLQRYQLWESRKPRAGIWMQPTSSRDTHTQSGISSPSEISCPINSMFPCFITKGSKQPPVARPNQDRCSMNI